MNENMYDYDKLRSHLIDSMLIAMDDPCFSMLTYYAPMDLESLDNATNEQLLKLADRYGLDLNKYLLESNKRHR